MKANSMAASNGTGAVNGRSDPLGANTDIGRKLKQYYDELISEEVPDRFAELLQRLEEREGPTARDGE